jgi:very-short-patch-repair endonuclease
MGERPMHGNATQTIFSNAQNLRKELTEAEEIVWNMLRNRKLENLKFRRQHPIDYFVLDFYCHELKLAVELDGEIHEKGENKVYDKNRTTRLRDLGITVLRFTNSEAKQNQKFIKDAILAHSRNFPPLPWERGQG